MARNRPSTHLLVVHCAATLPKQDIGTKEIHAWHLEKGIYSERGLTGYHFVIRRSGLIELGRDLPAIGAHARPHNDDSVGICLVGGGRLVKGATPKENKVVGEDNFEEIQKANLAVLLRALWLMYPDALLCPHNAIAKKDCPSFGLWEWQLEVFGVSHEQEVLSYLNKENK